MELLTKDQLRQLQNNGRAPDKDYSPVIKLFMTGTPCTWLISELNPNDADMAFGLCDLGMGFPELGYVDLQELKESQTLLMLLKQDFEFQSNYPMSIYSRAAREAQQIVTDEASLQRNLKPMP